MENLKFHSLVMRYTVRVGAERTNVLRFTKYVNYSNVEYWLVHHNYRHVIQLS